jgi:aminopeptidase N
LALDLDLLVDAKRVKGSASLEFERVSNDARTLILDAVGFEIESVTLSAGDETRDTEWRYDGDQLHVEVPAEVADGMLQVDYSVVPRRGLYFIAPDEQVPHRPKQVWSQCQDEDARYWFPCHDAPGAKMTSELRVTVPAGWVALSNGELLEEPGGNEGERVFHFAFDAPHPSYLMTLVAGEFSVLEDRPAVMPDGRKVPVRYYVPQGREADAWRSLGITPQIIEYFSEVTGVAYPWPCYSQVVVSDFTFGGMENTTATTLFEYALLDERAALDINSVDLVAHELAHQWFGDYVTCRDWSEAWLNEGFATYFEHVEREHCLGRDEYDWGVLTDLETYLGESASHYTRPIVCREYQAPIDLFDRHLYEKGALVIHMLRRELGDETFFGGLRAYLEQHQQGVVETTDLKRTFERASGRSLDRFFDQWVYQAGQPEIEVNCTFDEGQLTVAAQQKLPEGMAPIEWQFEIEYSIANRTERLRKVSNQPYVAHVVRFAGKPDWIAVDPELRAAVSMQLEFPADLLRGTLAHAPSLRSRVLAAQALAKRTDVPSVNALRECLFNDRDPWMLRAECARSLGKLPVAESLSALIEGTRIEHPKVRRSVATALGAFKQPEAFKALRPLAEGDVSYCVQSQAARAIGNTRQPGALEILQAQLGQESYADMIRAAACDGLAALRDVSALESLRDTARYGKPSRGRRAAIAALGKLGETRAVREQLEELLQDPEFYIRVQAAQALVQMGDARAIPALESRLAVEREGRVVRVIRESLLTLGAGGPEAARKLADDVTGLQRKLDEMRARVERLEAARGLTSPTSSGAQAGGGSVSRTPRKSNARAAAVGGTSSERSRKAKPSRPAVPAKRKATRDPSSTKRASRKRVTTAGRPKKKAR